MAEFYPVYTGDAGLAVGEGALIAPDTKSFDAVQQAQSDRLKLLGDTQKTIALLDNQFNTQMFAQKVKDRDNMFKAFLDGNATVNDYLPEDAGALNDARKKYNDAYYAWAKNINNRDAAKSFKEAQDNLNDMAARIATRYKMKQDQDVDASKALIPEDKKAMLDNINGWVNAKDKTGKPSLPTIYQPYQKYNAEAFRGQAATGTVNLTSKDGLYTTPLTFFDYAQTKSKVDDSQKELGVAHVANEYQHKYFDTLSNADKQKQVDAINQAIELHNAKHPNDKVEPLNWDKNTGMLIDDPATYAAKFLLALNPDKTGTPVFNKDVAKFKTDQGKLGVDWYNAATKRMGQKLKERAFDKMNEPEQKFSQIWDQNLNNLQAAPITSTGIFGKKNEGVFQIDANQLPAGFTYVSGLDENGKPIQLKPIGGQYTPRLAADGKTKVTDSKGKPVYDYVGGYYIPQFYIPKGTTLPNGSVTNKDISLDKTDLQNMWNAAKKSGYNGQFKDYLLENFNNKTFDYNLQGENGTATRASSFVSQTMEANKGTKKGQVSPYDFLMGSDNQPEETTTTETETQTDNQ